MAEVVQVGAMVTRQQLVNAIESGITAARESYISPTECAQLRRVGREARRVAVGTCGGSVGCPIAQVLPMDWTWLTWGGAFMRAYDRAMRDRGVSPSVFTVEIVQ